MKNTALLYCEEAVAHNTGQYHPESPLRLKAIKLAFEENGIQLPVVRPEPATEADIQRNHTKAYIDTIKECCLGGSTYPDPDTVMGPESWNAALLSAGAGITAAKLVLDGTYDNAFSIMRPPGHHAEIDRAMGFCLFNNIAITAKWLQEEKGLERIAIFDFDVHHGNGTQNAFYDDASVLFISIHEYPHFPGTGFPYERGINNNIMNFQMPPGSLPELWITTIQENVVPQLEAFKPDMLLLSVGFDGHRLDPLGNQLLEVEHYGEITRMIKHIANGKIVSFLEGGYHLTALGQCVVSHVKALQE